MERERQRPFDLDTAHSAPAGGDDLEAARQLNDRAATAADEAIARVMSGDSPKFMRSARQRGGQ